VACCPSGCSRTDWAITPDLAEQIGRFQYRQLVGRSARPEDITALRAAGTQCAAAGCKVQDYARPLCFALLSSAEMLFY
jgi:hypothetical protein